MNKPNAEPNPNFIFPEKTIEEINTLLDKKYARAHQAFEFALDATFHTFAQSPTPDELNIAIDTLNATLDARHKALILQTFGNALRVLHSVRGDPRAFEQTIGKFIYDKTEDPIFTHSLNLLDNLIQTIEAKTKTEPESK